MSRVLRLHPVLWFVVGLAVFYWGIDIVLTIQFRHMGVQEWPSQTIADLRVEHLIVLCFFAFAYGGWRAAAFHPLRQKGYFNWLQSTPWSAGMPLPLGPVAFAWWDGIMVASLIVLSCWPAGMSSAAPLLALSCSYLLISLGLSFETNIRGAFVLAICIGISLRFVRTWEAAAAISVPLAVLANISVLCGLRTFPWEKDPAARPPETPGWLDMIPPNYAPLVSSRHALAACLLVACWSWSLLSLTAEHAAPEDVFFVVLMMAATGSVVRCIAYCVQYRPPLTIWARVRTGKFLIPRYDYVFIAPLFGLAAGWAIPRGLLILHIPLAVSGAIGIATSLAILLMAPPALRVWDLTGFHRRIQFARSTPRRSRQRSPATRLL